jgi:hypothetical protein
MRIRPGAVWIIAAGIFIAALVLPSVRIPRYVDWVIEAMLITLFVLAFVLATFGTGRAVIRAWVRSRLLRIGRQTTAKVLDITVSGLLQPTIDDVVIVRMRLALPSERPARLVDLQETMDVDWVPKVGDEIPILVDPRRPWRFRLSPDFYALTSISRTV